MKTINSKILITGASGNLGRALIRHLSQIGYINITGSYCHKAENLPLLPGVKWSKLDILDIIALEDIMKENEIVIHLAGIVSYQPKDKARILKINIEGTANVVNTANNGQIKKLIHISSTAAFGIPTEPRIQDESYIPDPTQFITDYALSKWYGELEVWRGISEGLNAVILAPSIIINPADNKANTGIFKEKIKEGLSYYPSGKAGFIHVKDVANAIALLIENEIEEEKLILNSSNLSWQSFFAMIARNLDLSTNFKPIPSSYRALLSFKNSVNSIFGKAISIPSAMAKHMDQMLEYDGQLITEVLPFKYYSIDETIEEYCLDQ